MESLERAAIPLAHNNSLVVEPVTGGSVLRLFAADGADDFQRKSHVRAFIAEHPICTAS